MDFDLQAQEEFLRSGEQPSASVIRNDSASASSTPPQPQRPTLLSAFSSAKEIRERDRKRDTVVLEVSASEKGFPAAESIPVRANKRG